MRERLPLTPASRAVIAVLLVILVLAVLLTVRFFMKLAEFDQRQGMSYEQGFAYDDPVRVAITGTPRGSATLEPRIAVDG